MWEEVEWIDDKELNTTKPQYENGYGKNYHKIIKKSQDIIKLPKIEKYAKLCETLDDEQIMILNQLLDDIDISCTNKMNYLIKTIKGNHENN